MPASGQINELSGPMPQYVSHFDAVWSSCIICIYSLSTCFQLSLSPGRRQKLTTRRPEVWTVPNFKFTKPSPHFCARAQLLQKLLQKELVAKALRSTDVSRSQFWSAITVSMAGSSWWHPKLWPCHPVLGPVSIRTSCGAFLFRAILREQSLWNWRWWESKCCSEDWISSHVFQRIAVSCHISFVLCPRPSAPNRLRRKKVPRSPRSSAEASRLEVGLASVHVSVDASEPFTFFAHCYFAPRGLQQHDSCDKVFGFDKGCLCGWLSISSSIELFHIKLTKVVHCHFLANCRIWATRSSWAPHTDSSAGKLGSILRTSGT